MTATDPEVWKRIAEHAAAGDPHPGYIPVHVATVAPTVDDDETLGYEIRTIWIDTVGEDAYFLTDATTGAAVWNAMGGGTGAPDSADYLVGTAQGGLSAEIVVGATPGGELGGTWGTPTVDATHSGSAHHSAVTVGTGLDVTGQLVELDLSEVASGGELGGFMDAPTVDATHSGSTHSAATDTHIADTSDAHDASAISILDAGNDFTATDVEGALDELQADNEAHVAAADPHTGYRLESADHTHASSGAQGGLVAAATETLTGVAELATAAETAAGTDATRIITAVNAFAVFFKQVAVQVFTTIATNTYTPTAGMKYCLVISTGAGGGGGGADGNDGTSDVAVAGGGGAGGTCIELFTAADVGASISVVLNAVGTAGSGTNGTSGGTGGNTTFGTGGTLKHTAVGGGLGTGSGLANSVVAAVAGGVGGVPTNGLVNINGGDGGYGVGAGADNTVDFTFGHSGNGGASFWGSGGRGGAASLASLTTDANVAGLAGIAYGSGGGGAVSLNSTTGAAGGAGANGICVVIEFI